MRILLISQYYFPEPFRVTEMSEKLVSLGHQVTVITGQPNYPSGQIYSGYNNRFEMQVINGVTVFRTKIYPRGNGKVRLFLNYISFPFFARKTINQNLGDFDIVFIYQLSPVFSAIPGIQYARRHKLKTILYCLDLWPESIVSGGIKRNSLIYNIIHSVSAKIYKKASKILISSRLFSDYFETNFNISRNKIEYLPQFADTIFENHEEYYIEKTINSNITNFVFAGNIGKMQSVETIIEAAKYIRDYKNIQINIIGDGSEYNRIQNLIESYKLENVFLLGRKPVEEMSYYYSTADAMIITLKKSSYISYTIPGKFQSYLAFGKPIIGSIDGEVNTIIRESQCGLVCDAENPIELSKILLSFAKSNNASEYAKNSRALYQKSFSQEVFFQKLESILNEEVEIDVQG